MQHIAKEIQKNLRLVVVSGESHRVDIGHDRTLVAYGHNSPAFYTAEFPFCPVQLEYVIYNRDG